MAKSNEKSTDASDSGAGSENIAPVATGDENLSEADRLAALQSELPPPPQAIPDTSKQAEGESWADYRARSDRGNFAERLREG